MRKGHGLGLGNEGGEGREGGEGLGLDISFPIRRRLQELIGLGGISDSALCDLLERLSEDPLDGSVNRHTCHRAARDAINDVKHTIELRLAKGGHWTWTFLHPVKLLQKVLKKSSQLSSEFKVALGDHPNTQLSPWGLIWYFDELTPGAILRLDNKRKSMAVYLSFAQLGQARLSKTEFWMTIAVVRTHMIRKIEGGWSNMFRHLLRCAFLETENYSVGIVLHLDAPCLFFAQLSNVIADEAALKQYLDSKGSSGLRSCTACKNVLSRASDVASRDNSGYLVEVTCTDTSRFDLASDADMFEVADLLIRSRDTMGATAFRQLEMSIGFNLNRLGLLADVELRPHSRPASSMTWDPMHCWWSNGIVAFEIHEFLNRMKATTSFGWSDIETFCKSDWQFPFFCRAKGRAIYEVFNEARERSCHESFKAGATEAILVLPLLLFFGELFLVQQLPREVACLRALCDVAHEAQEAKFGRGDPGKLAASIRKHFDEYQRTYPDANVKPKHHYSCHLPDQLRRDRFLLDAFTLERKHQAVKTASSSTDNTSDYEVSVLCRIHLDELRSHSELDCKPGLRGKQARCWPLQATIADGLEWSGLRFHSGDVLFVGAFAIFVRGAILTDGGNLELLVTPLQLGRRISSFAAEWKRQPGVFRYPLRDVRPASCWTVDGDNFTILGR